MRQSDESAQDSNDFWEVSHAAAQFANFACTISARHLQDDQTRMQFNRELAYYARRVVLDVQERRLSAEEGLREIKAEQRSLLNQSSRIIHQALGFIGGAGQVISGTGICYGSAGALCPILGLPLIAHGGNNLYENARNFYEDRDDIEGPVRKGYQLAARKIGYGVKEGNIAYLGADVSMSVYSMSRLVLKPDSWRLFRYLKADHERAHLQMSKFTLGVEIGTSSLTGAQLYNEHKK